MRTPPIPALASALAAAFTIPASAQPDLAGDFGVVHRSVTTTGTLEPAAVLWFRIELTGDEHFLDITTNDTPTISGTLEDTEIALYDALGRLIATDDDDGLSTRSTLSFGTGSGLRLGDFSNLGNGFATGQDGPLPPPGVYYIALGEFDTVFTDSDFLAGNNGSGFGGSFVLSAYTGAAPAPGGTAALLVFAASAARRRR